MWIASTEFQESNELGPIHFPITLKTYNSITHSLTPTVTSINTESDMILYTNPTAVQLPILHHRKEYTPHSRPLYRYPSMKKTPSQATPILIVAITHNPHTSHSQQHNKPTGFKYAPSPPKKKHPNPNHPPTSFHFHSTIPILTYNLN